MYIPGWEILTERLLFGNPSVKEAKPGHAEVGPLAGTPLTQPAANIPTASYGNTESVGLQPGL